MNAITIENLSKTYQSKEQPVKALEEVSFTIKKGELFGLLGPNGAGKSTIINMLGGVVKKTSGKVLINDIDIDKDHRSAKMLIGIVPQEFSFDVFLTVEQALKLQFGYYNQPYSKDRLDKILTDLSLDDKRSVNPRWLSGGMKRRFMIARALVHDPEILFLDEPSAGVDVELRHDMYDLISDLNKQGKTIILTTHYLEEVELLCDRVAIMRKGKLIALDKKEALKERFQSKREFQLALTKELTEAPASLKKFNPKIDGTKLTLQFEEADYQEILQLVAKADLPVANFSVIEPSIEDVFLGLTKETETV
jgi:ABC-2 type transport system ATP-binding protein